MKCAYFATAPTYKNTMQLGKKYVIPTRKYVIQIWAKLNEQISGETLTINFPTDIKKAWFNYIMSSWI